MKDIRRRKFGITYYNDGESDNIIATAPLDFTRAKDAVAYAKAKKPEGAASWEVRQWVDVWMPSGEGNAQGYYSEEAEGVCAGVYETKETET